MKLIRHPQVSTSSKKKLFTDIFRDKIEEDLLSFLLVLIDKGRILQLEGKLKEMEKINLERNNTVIAKVKTVVSLQDDEKKSLVENLEKKFNKKVFAGRRTRFKYTWRSLCPGWQWSYRWNSEI